MKKMAEENKKLMDLKTTLIAQCQSTKNLIEQTDLSVAVYLFIL
jgi:hypothetical protein